MHLGGNGEHTPTRCLTFGESGMFSRYSRCQNWIRCPLLPCFNGFLANSSKISGGRGFESRRRRTFFPCFCRWILHLFWVTFFQLRFLNKIRPLVTPKYFSHACRFTKRQDAKKKIEKKIAAVATNFFLEGGVHFKSPQNNRRSGEKAVNPNSKHQKRFFVVQSKPGMWRAQKYL